MDSGTENPSPANQDNAKQPTSPAGHDKNPASFAVEFESLPDDYQKVLRFAQDQHGIRVVPLQELKGGFTGAVLYLVSVSLTTSNKLEHLVLKLDRPQAGEPDELDRHNRALEQAPPDFAREHMAEVAFDRVELDGSIAIFYRIAGESLHGYQPIATFQRQSQVQAIFSVLDREILTRWNATAAGFDQAVHPQTLLFRWLNDRLRPQGNIENFFKEIRRIDSGKPGLIIQGRVYPNPLLFARDAAPWGRARVIDALAGFQHGDLNVNNVLVRFDESGANLEGYYFIDFAFYEERMPLLYDQAYLEMAFLLPYVATVDFAKWTDLVTRFASQDIPDPESVPVELAGAAAAISTGRREFDLWIREHHASLTDDLWGQYWLAATAVGLNFCGKGGLPEQQRLGGLIFAAAHLKRYCEKFGVPLPVDVAHLYEPSDVREQPKASTAVSRSPVEAASVPKNDSPVQLNSFVGRKRELGELTVALEEAVSGQGRLFMLAGEPGIGKTRTTQELASYAEDRGAKVFWGRCYEEEGAPPYWPWLQIIRSYVQQAGTDQLIAELGAGAADIAEIVPNIQGKITDLETPQALDPESARFRLFDSIATFLKNASQSQPLMLVLDDLQWADRSSLLLLEFVSRELGDSRLFLVGCYRDTELSRRHPLAETLARLSREPVFRRQVLGGLGQDELGQFIEAATGAQPSQELTDTIYAHTEGNPFFMTEVIRLLSESGELTGGGSATPDGLGIPEGVRDVIGQRLNRLSEERKEVLTTASIIGREFDFRLLNILSGEMSEDQLLQTVDDAMSIHLIQEVPGQIDRYQFTHSLIQQTLADGITTSRRVRLHARIAGALEELYGEDAESHAAELAYHYARADAVAGPDKLVYYSLLAGERALAAYAIEDALAHFESGLTARNISLSGTEAASDEEAAALLFGLARARSAIFERHQLAEAFATQSRAFEYYAEAGNVARAVAAAEFPIATPATPIPGIAQLLARALTLVSADSHEAGRLLSRYGGIIGSDESDYEGSQQALGRAMAIARREGDVPLEVQTLTYAAAVSGQHLQFQESVDNGLRAIELATGGENLFSVVISRYWTALGLLRLGGNLDAVRPYVLSMRDLAEKRTTPRPLARIGFNAIIHLACLEGDWKAGRESSDRGLEMSPLDPQLMGPRILLEHETGESTQGEVYLERLLQMMRQSGPHQMLASAGASVAIATSTRITGVPDRWEIAEAAAEAALSERSFVPLYVLYARSGLALLAVQKGDKSAAEEHHAYLLGQRGTMILTVSSADRLLGLLSQTMGNLDQAAGHFEDALAFCRKAGYRPELAWTCCDFSDALQDRDGEGDRVRAMSLLDESLAISSELGMRPLHERAASRRESLEV